MVYVNNANSKTKYGDKCNGKLEMFFEIQMRIYFTLSTFEVSSYNNTEYNIKQFSRVAPFKCFI